MTEQKKSLSGPQRWLILILIAYLILGLSYSIVIPLAETPDESEHFRYMQAIVLTGELPVMQPEREANVTIEAHQPPLYYMFGAALNGRLDLDPADNPPDNTCFSFEPHDPGRKTAYLHYSDEWPPQRDLYRAFQTMRWLSLLMGAATICLAYVIGRQVLPGAAWFAPAAAAILAFNPQFIFIMASMNNDVPTTLLGASIVALAVSAINRPRPSVYLLLGIAAGLGILTKFALIAFWPLAFLAAVWPSVQISRRPSALHFKPKGLISRLLIVTILPLLIAGWWYVRNYQLYGDPLMWEVTLAAKGSVIARTSPFTLADLGEFLSLHFQSYWLWFGWLNIKAPAWLYGLLLLLCLIAVVGLVWLLVKRRLPVNLSALAINALAVISIYASLLQYIQTINWTGYQGRLAFAAAASIAMFIALGLAALGGKRLAAAAAGGLLILSVAALFFLLYPAYPRPDIYQPGPELTQTCARFEGGLQVEALASEDRVLPGESLPVTVHAYGLADSTGLQRLLVRLVGDNGQEAGRETAVLSWKANEVVSTAVNLPVSAGAVPARAVLQVAMLGEDGAYQAATSATGRVLDIPVGVDTVKIAAPTSPAPTAEFQTSAYFGDQLLLLGYDVQDTEEGWEVTLYWQAQEEITADYTTFVHILDETGQLIAQDDSQPTGGVYPTSIWDKGEIVADRKVLILPQNGLEGAINVVSGVYLLETLERLPVSDANGRVLPNDQWPLELDTFLGSNR